MACRIRPPCARPWRGGAPSSAASHRRSASCLPAHLQARDTTVQPHALETYDQAQGKPRCLFRHLICPKTENDTLRARAEALHAAWVADHTGPRSRPSPGWRRCSTGRSSNAPARSLERRLSAAHIGRFKTTPATSTGPWPKHCDRAAVDALITLDFLKEAANVVFVGPNGVGKSMFKLRTLPIRR